MNELSIEYVHISDLKPYEHNAKVHTAEQVEQIKESITQFGMNDPIAVWQDNVIIEGHGRYLACLQLGIEEIPVIRLDSLTDEERRAYMLVHNQTTMNTGFEFNILENELGSIENIDMSYFGFDIDAIEPLIFEDKSGGVEFREETTKEEVVCPNCGLEFIP